MANNAISYGGVNSSYTLLKSGTIISTLTNSTISLWFQTRTTGNPPFDGWAMYCERDSSGNDIWKVDMFGDTPGQPGITHRDDAGSLTFIRHGTAFNDAKPHHMVITKAGTAISIYIDRTSVVTGTLNGNDTFTNAGLEARIGGDKGDADCYFDGIIDDLRIFNYTLSANDVRKLYGGRTTGGTAPIGWWKCDDGTGTNVTDEIGTNNGTLSGTTLPTWVTGISPVPTTLSKVGLRPYVFGPGLAR